MNECIKRANQRKIKMSENVTLTEYSIHMHSNSKSNGERARRCWNTEYVYLWTEPREDGIGCDVTFGATHACSPVKMFTYSKWNSERSMTMTWWVVCRDDAFVLIVLMHPSFSTNCRIFHAINVARPSLSATDFFLSRTFMQWDGVLNRWKINNDFYEMQSRFESLKAEYGPNAPASLPQIRNCSPSIFGFIIIETNMKEIFMQFPCPCPLCQVAVLGTR